MMDKCQWKYEGIATNNDEPYYTTSCINIKEQKSDRELFKFCPYCGRQIEELTNEQ